MGKNGLLQRQTNQTSDFIAISKATIPSIMRQSFDEQNSQVTIIGLAKTIHSKISSTKSTSHPSKAASLQKFNFCNRHNAIIITIILQIILIIGNFIAISNGEVVVYTPTNSSIEVFDDIELFFGSVPTKGIFGKVVLADPEDACSKLKNKVPKDNGDNWFLLAKRYPCLLEKKVRNAAEAGYKAIIVYSGEPNSNRRLMNADTMDIVSVLISRENGENIKQNYMHDKGYTIGIFPVYQFPLDNYLLPFAVVIIVCLFLMILFLIFQIIKCARVRRKLHRHRLTTKQLKQLLTTIYSKGCHYDTCAICLEEYVEGEKLRVLPCAHGYHLRCIDPWLTKSRRICPVCKGKVRVSGMSDISDTESESDQPRARRPRPYVPSYGTTANSRTQRNILGTHQQQPQASTSRFFVTRIRALQRAGRILDGGYTHPLLYGNVGSNSGTSSLSGSLISSDGQLSSNNITSNSNISNTGLNNNLTNDNNSNSNSNNDPISQRANESTPLLQDQRSTNSTRSQYSNISNANHQDQAQSSHRHHEEI